MHIAAKFSSGKFTLHSLPHQASIHSPRAQVTTKDLTVLTVKTGKMYRVSTRSRGRSNTLLTPEEVTAGSIPTSLSMRYFNYSVRYHILSESSQYLLIFIVVTIVFVLISVAYTPTDIKKTLRLSLSHTPWTEKRSTFGPIN